MLRYGCLSGVSEVSVVQKNRSTAGMKAVQRELTHRRSQRDAYRRYEL